MTRLASRVVDDALSYFSAEEVARARSYHRPLYWARAAGLAIDAGVLALLAWTELGDSLDPNSLPWWSRAPAYAATVIAVLTAVAIPLGLWNGLVRERRWGFSTERLSSWLFDRLKELVVNVILTASAFLAVIALAHAFPGWWVVPVAAALASIVLLLSFVAPVVLEPMFNRYEPMRDEALGIALRRLAERAGVPVRDVLVQDASRRTQKANAYVSGLGATRRVVVSDTLLEEASPAEIELVVAHELGHRHHGHVLQGTLLLMAGVVVDTAVVWALLGTHVADPHRIPVVMLIGLVLGLLGLPLLTACSRTWERMADRFALELTDDRASYQSAFHRLARTNLSDLDPPRLLYLLLFTHPTPPERLAAAAPPTAHTVIAG
jgi:STE24 endopeptidase